MIQDYKEILTAKELRTYDICANLKFVYMY